MISQTRFFSSIETAAYAAGAVGILLACLALSRVSPVCNLPKATVWGGFAPAPANSLDGVSSIFVVDRRFDSGAMSKRFRLAGTVMGGGYPMAVIDDKTLVRQKIVRAGQTVAPGVSVMEITPQSVLLRDADSEERIFLEGSVSLAAAARESDAGAAAFDSHTEPGTRFGIRQVFPGRWEFSRDTLLEYYGELRNEPERLLSIFDSMDPVYEDDEAGRPYINGYVVGVEGEKDFFSAVGLKNGDIVRAVNSVPMTNRRKAEAFISEFVVKGGVGMYVLEIERDGVVSKQVYNIK